MENPEELSRKIRDMASSEKFIPGIYNYCDRWCERCAFTSRCLNYAHSPKAEDLRDDDLFEYLSSVFKATIQMLEEAALEMGINLSELDDVVPAEKAAPFLDPMTRFAKDTSDAIHQWLMEVDNTAGASRFELLRTRPGRSDRYKDALEVIMWYNFFIAVKLERAVKSASNKEHIEYRMQDANGSAKVALIGLDRSIASWSVVMEEDPEHEDDILHFLIRLAKIRGTAEKRFPGARGFIRPGLDE